MAMCLGVYAYAQDTSDWKAGDDVTTKLQWKAYDSQDEDVNNPAWQGFKYLNGTESDNGGWEFRLTNDDILTSYITTGDGNVRKNFNCWGVYNVETWNIYQDFEIPAGLYTLKVAGCYREGATQTTFDKWVEGNKTNNAFLYVTVNGETSKTPLMYMFTKQSTASIGNFDSWMADCHFKSAADGVEYYGPSCHGGADAYIESGLFNWNELLFVVPEKTTIRVGIDKPVAQSQDQGWWNHWRIIYNSPYNDFAKAYVAMQSFNKAKAEAEAFVNTVQSTYGTLGALMADEVSDIKPDDDKSLESVNAAIEELAAADAANRDAYIKTGTMEFVIGICQGISKATDFAGKEAFDAAIEKAYNTLYDQEFGVESVADFVAAGEELAKARIAYLMTQKKAEDGSIDLTHAVSNPWFVNQEYTPSYSDGEYKFPEEIENTWFSDAFGDEKSMEEAFTPDGAEEAWAPIADKAHWSTNEKAENRWVYVDKWNGWHGGMQNAIQKIKKYPAWYSGWAAGANIQGGMIVSQVLTNLPSGFYTLEGYAFTVTDGYADNGNQYLFINDAQGNEVAKVKNENPAHGYWDWTGSPRKEWWTKLATDFIQLADGKYTIGYHHNSMTANSGVVLKYYGATIDYTNLVQNRIDESKPQEGYLWAGDQATYDEMVAAIQFPVVDGVAYKAALAQLAEADKFKEYAHGITSTCNISAQYADLMDKYAEGAQAEIFETAWAGTLELGNGETDSHKDVETAKAIYNAYVEYINTYDRAESYAKYSEALVTVMNEQAVSLKAAYADEATLAKYASELSAPLNIAIFKAEGAEKATEADPMDITNILLVNADLSQGPKTGWSLDVADPSVNTYGRQLAECWNQQPFKISQTLRQLPAGCYELSVRACYRSGSAVNQEMIDAFKAGEGLNAFVYAKTNKAERSEAIKPVCEGEWADPSFTAWYAPKDANVGDDFKALGFMADWDGTIYISEEEFANLANVGADVDLIDVLASSGKKEINLDSPEYPFDTKVGDFYYPSSMAGFQNRCAKNPEVYNNKVQIMVEEGEDLELGIIKVAAVSGDWLIYDDFKLHYLGTQTPTAINSINVSGANKTIFNIAGQQLNSLQKGINIVNGKKVYVK